MEPLPPPPIEDALNQTLPLLSANFENAYFKSSSLFISILVGTFIPPFLNA